MVIRAIQGPLMDQPGYNLDLYRGTSAWKCISIRVPHFQNNLLLPSLIVLFPSSLVISLVPIWDQFVSVVMRVFTQGQLLWSFSLLTLVAGFPGADTHGGNLAHRGSHKRCPY